MKTISIFLFTLLFNTAFAQSSFKDGWKDGYKFGYCQGVTPCGALTPMVPALLNGNYQDGYELGKKRGSEDREKREGSTNTNQNQGFGPDLRDLNPFEEQTNNVNQTNLPLSPPSIEIIKEISVNLNSYTHVAVVDVNFNGFRIKYHYKNTVDNLLSSPLQVINPLDDKKSWRKNPLYLRDTKKEEWLYLYVSKSKIGADNIVMFTVRDFRNEVIYSAKSTNISISEYLAPIVNF